MKTILVDAVDAFVIEDGNTFKIFEKMHDLLESFPNKKIILTGANDEQYKEFCLDKMPYEVFTLKHNPEKTDPKYYETMLKHFGLDKNDVVYFEHNQKAVESAQLVGIKTYYFDNNKRNLEELKKFLIENMQDVTIDKNQTKIVNTADIVMGIALFGEIVGVFLRTVLGTALGTSDNIYIGKALGSLLEGVGGISFIFALILLARRTDGNTITKRGWYLRWSLLGFWIIFKIFSPKFLI